MWGTKFPYGVKYWLLNEGPVIFMKLTSNDQCDKLFLWPRSYQFVMPSISLWLRVEVFCVEVLASSVAISAATCASASVWGATNKGAGWLMLPACVWALYHTTVILYAYRKKRPSMKKWPPPPPPTLCPVCSSCSEIRLWFPCLMFPWSKLISY